MAATMRGRPAPCRLKNRFFFCKTDRTWLLSHVFFSKHCLNGLHRKTMTECPFKAGRPDFPERFPFNTRSLGLCKQFQSAESFEFGYCWTVEALRFHRPTLVMISELETSSHHHPCPCAHPAHLRSTSAALPSHSANALSCGERGVLSTPQPNKRSLEKEKI